MGEQPFQGKIPMGERFLSEKYPSGRNIWLRKCSCEKSSCGRRIRLGKDSHRANVHMVDRGC